LPLIISVPEITHSQDKGIFLHHQLKSKHEFNKLDLKRD